MVHPRDVSTNTALKRSREPPVLGDFRSYTRRGKYRGVVCYVPKRLARRSLKESTRRAKSGSPPCHAIVNSLAGTEALSPDWFFNSLVGHDDPPLRG
jgi:hypothetical protein